MTESCSFSSLKDLVDSHLSKTKLQESQSDDAGGLPGKRFPIPSLMQCGTLSDSRLVPGSFSALSGHRLPIPSFNVSDNSITQVLAEQVSNMLKAKELKKQQEEEKRKLVEEMTELKIEDDYVIDLMEAVQTPHNALPRQQEVISRSSSLDSLFNPKYDDLEPSVVEHTMEVEEPIITNIDIEKILTTKLKKGKCSTFGKVMTARLRPVATPYLSHKNYNTQIVPFDFKSKSPCDLIKEKLRKPTMSVSYNVELSMY